MNHRNLLLFLLVSFTQAPLYAMSRDVVAHFIVGYFHGAAAYTPGSFLLLVDLASGNPRQNNDLVHPAAVVGYAAGIATLAIPVYWCCCGFKRLLAGRAPENRFGENQAIAGRLNRLEEHTGLHARTHGLEDEQAHVRVATRDLEKEYAQ